MVNCEGDMGDYRGSKLVGMSESKLWLILVLTSVATSKHSALVAVNNVTGPAICRWCNEIGLY